MGFLPLVWRPKEFPCWIEILHQVKPRHVVNCFGGQGALEVACCCMGITCATFAWNRTHEEYLCQQIDSMLISQVFTDNTWKALCCTDDVIAQIKKVFKAQFEVPSRVDATDEPDDASSDSTSDE